MFSIRYSITEDFTEALDSKQKKNFCSWICHNKCAYTHKKKKKKLN